MDWAMNGVVDWLYTKIAALLNFISTGFLESMNCSLATFDQYFPFAAKAYDIIRGFAIGLLFLILIFQLAKNFFGPMSDAENPIFLFIKTVVFTIPVLGAKSIYEGMLTLIGTPYSQILGLDTSLTVQPEKTIQWKAVGDTVGTVINASPTAQSSGGAVVGDIVAIVVLVVIGWNFFKLILEAAERYIIIGVLAYTAPLPVSTGASKSTSNIMKGWCRMAASQLIMLILNVWSIKMIIMAFTAFGFTNGKVTTDGQTVGGIVTWTICMLAFLKIAQKMDTYMATIGMNTAQTGSSFMGDILASGFAIKSGVSAISKGIGAVGGAVGTAAFGKSGSHHGGPSSGGGGIGGLGAANAAADVVSKGGVRQGVGGIVGGISRAVAGGRFNRGLGATDWMDPNYNLATNTIGKIAKGDIKSTGMLVDNPLAKKSSDADLGTRSYGHFFDLKGTPDANVSDVTMGGGRITGTGSDGNQFALYDSGSYNAPIDSNYETMSAVDGSTWYKQTFQQSYEPEMRDVPDNSGKMHQQVYTPRPPSPPRRKDRV